MYELIIIPAAQNDAADGFLYYQRINDNLAISFLQVLEDLYNKLQTLPHNYSFFDKPKQLRSVAFMKFPYSIIFQIIDNSVFIYAIVNTHQNPQNLINRI